jgi:hypothetical protein
MRFQKTLNKPRKFNDFSAENKKNRSIFALRFQFSDHWNFFFLFQVKFIFVKVVEFKF